MKKLVACLVLAAVLGGCSMKADLSQTDSQISAFHKQLDGGDFDGIYANTNPEFKRVSKEADMAQLFSAIHRKLGQFVSGKTTGWRDNLTVAGHYVSVQYSAQYTNGIADESFVYRLDGGNSSLVGYHINSLALIVN